MEFFHLLALLVFTLTLLYMAFILGKKFAKKEFEDTIPQIREVAVKKSRSVISGQMSEQIAPYFPDFPFKPTESRFIGKPIDFVVFKGMDEKKIDEVVFVEVKTGQSQLSSVEKSLKEAIQNKKMSWAEYRLPEKKDN